jgi:hypothetical protein
MISPINEEINDCCRFYLPFSNGNSYIGNGSYRSQKPITSGLIYRI